MIDPTLQPYLDMWKTAWSGLAPDATIVERRAVLARLADEARQPLPDGIVSEERFIPGEHRAVRVRIYRPAAELAVPALVYMHGGGWMQGSPETHEEITAAIAEATGSSVISVDYALAPEQPFPAAVHDCEAVVRWAFGNATELRIDAEAVSVGGDSAGANLAAAMTLVFRGARERLRGQMLFYPAVDFEHSAPSYTENADGPIIATRDMDATRQRYMPNQADWTNPLAAPLRAKDHAGLPPAFIAVAEHDPLRDDGLAYAEKLGQAGVAVELHRGKGLFHGYLRAMSSARVARAPLDEACAWFARLNDAR